MAKYGKKMGGMMGGMMGGKGSLINGAGKSSDMSGSSVCANKGGNMGKPIGDKGMKASGNKRTRQVADRYK